MLFPNGSLYSCQEQPLHDQRGILNTNLVLLIPFFTFQNLKASTEDLECVFHVLHSQFLSPSPSLNFCVNKSCYCHHMFKIIISLNISPNKNLLICRYIMSSISPLLSKSKPNPFLPLKVPWAFKEIYFTPIHPINFLALQPPTYRTPKRISSETSYYHNDHTFFLHNSSTSSAYHLQKKKKKSFILNQATTPS